MNLLIVVQSHSITDSQKLLGYIKPEKLRYPGVAKSEVSRRCLLSLVDSINYLVEKRSEVDVKLVVIDDHSTDDFIENLKHIISLANCNTELIHLENHGLLESIKACYHYGKDYGKDFVYFAQDDYLYEETCLEEMLDIYFQLKPKNVGKSICVYPYNDPYRYLDKNIVPIRLVQGMKRHWRTSYQVACCFMVDHETLTSEWDLFEDFYNHVINEKIEDDTINKLFQQRNYVLLTPVPSLALHIQYETEKDPYIDWTLLWNKYDSTIINVPEKVVLNIGSGGTKLNFDCFNDYTEITYDADKSVNPDIVGDINNLTVFKNNSIDVVFASHILEHIYTHEVPDVVKNIYRIIKENGLAFLIVPNLKHLAKNLAEGKLDEVLYQSEAGPICALDMLYGASYELKNGKFFMAHKTGFTKELVFKLLDFLNIQGYVLEVESNLFIVLSKKSIENLCVNPEIIMKEFYAS